jgi:sec-independent protein translocase protein TatA
MFNIGTPEMVLIAFIALVVVGPQRLPSLFRQIGRGLAQFRQIQDDVKDMVNLDQYIDLKDPEGDFIKPPPPKPTPHRSRVASDDDLVTDPDDAADGDGAEGDLEHEPHTQNGAARAEPSAFTPTPVPEDDEPPLSAP